MAHPAALFGRIDRAVALIDAGNNRMPGLNPVARE